MYMSSLAFDVLGADVFLIALDMIFTITAYILCT